MPINVTEQRIRKHLWSIAQKRKTISYTDLANQCQLGLNMFDIAQRNRLTEFLAHILREEVYEGRPPLCVLVVREKEQMPGKGFFDYMDELGLRVAGEDNIAMFVRVLKNTHDFYNTPLGGKFVPP